MMPRLPMFSVLLLCLLTPPGAAQGETEDEAFLRKRVEKVLLDPTITEYRFRTASVELGDMHRGYESLSKAIRMYKGKDKQRWSYAIQGIAMGRKNFAQNVDVGLVPEFAAHAEWLGNPSIGFLKAMGARAKDALPTLRKIQDSPDTSRALAAFQAVRAIEADLKKKQP
jgi:hypothetical protein